MTLEQLQEIVEAMQKGNTAMANLKNYIDTCHHTRMPLVVAEQVADTVNYADTLSTVLHGMAQIALIRKAQTVLESAGYTVTKK